MVPRDAEEHEMREYLTSLIDETDARSATLYAVATTVTGLALYAMAMAWVWIR